MKEINLLAGQFVNLSAQGLPNTKLLLQNQGKDVMYIFKKSVQPTMDDPALDIFHWRTEEVDNSAGDIWISSYQNGTLFATTSSDMGHQTVELPSDMMTSTKEGIRRLRVDNGETGFYDGRMFEFRRKITSPIVFRFVSTVPFMLHGQQISCSEGDIELFTWSSADVTASGTWTPMPYWNQNEVNTSYARQATVSSGGTIVVNNPLNYRDYARAKTSSATAQQTTVQGTVVSSRYHNPGTFYLQMVGTGTGSLYFNWEDRP